MLSFSMFGGDNEWRELHVTNDRLPLSKLLADYFNEVKTTCCVDDIGLSGS